MKIKTWYKIIDELIKLNQDGNSSSLDNIMDLYCKECNMEKMKRFFKSWEMDLSEKNIYGKVGSKCGNFWYQLNKEAMNIQR